MTIPQYITQLSKQWIRDVSKRLTAGNCIRVKEDENNRIIDVDIDALKLLLGNQDLSNYVTKAGNETITGQKTFSSRIYLTDDNGSSFIGSSLLYLKAANASPIIAFCDSPTASSYKASIQLRADDGRLNISDSTAGICLITSANGATLSNAPTVSATATNSKVIASCGWVASLFSPQTHGHTEYATTNHTHSGYAESNHTHSGYATTGMLASYALLTDLDKYVETSTLDDAIDTKINTFSQTFSQSMSETYATIASHNTLSDEVDLVSQGLNALTEWEETGISSATINVVTDVVWTGSVLQKKSVTCTVANGIVTSVSAEATAAIDTPNVIQWS